MSRVVRQLAGHDAELLPGLGQSTIVALRFRVQLGMIACENTKNKSFREREVCGRQPCCNISWRLGLLFLSAHITDLRPGT